MEKLNFTPEKLINNLTFTKSDYDKAAESSNANASFAEFIQGVMDACRECNGTLDDAVFQAEDAFEKLGKKTYDVQFDNDDYTNSKGWHETFEYCKDYIESYNGTNESYFEDYKGGTVSIYCNETDEEVYSERVK